MLWSLSQDYGSVGKGPPPMYRYSSQCNNSSVNHCCWVGHQGQQRGISIADVSWVTWTFKEWIQMLIQSQMLYFTEFFFKILIFTMQSTLPGINCVSHQSLAIQEKIFTSILLNSRFEKLDHQVNGPPGWFRWYKIRAKKLLLFQKEVSSHWLYEHVRITCRSSLQKRQK